jgi:nucleoside-diphosphate-sugar epimerase
MAKGSMSHADRVSKKSPIARLTPNYTWADRTVLITGGTGFLGQRLTRRLTELGARVTVALCDQDDSARITALPPEADRRDGDVRNYGQVRQLVEAVAPDFVFHLAAVGVNDPFIAEETALRVNVRGTLNTLRAVQRAGAAHVQRVVVAGTSYEYGKTGELDPGNVYAASKVAAWAFCRMYYRAHGTPVVVARPFNVYGPGQAQQALIPAAIRAALSGHAFPTTPGEQRRDFIYVDDVVNGFLVIAATAGIEGESLDLGTGHATTVRDVVDRIFALCGGAGRPKIGALPYRPGIVWESVADAARTERLTGWQARTGLEEGLKLTIKAFAKT